jgi:2-amino-4-hydroxy-6-hydroxymethyldihydropteridine diphosphokinase
VPPHTTAPAALALGANLGDTHAALASALRHLARLPHTSLAAAATPILTAPVGVADQPPFLNSAAILHTALSPQDLLRHCLDIERLHGRTREPGQRWGPRTLDIDLILYADLQVALPGLTIPHPRLHERLFVLEPLAQIAPDWVVPGLGLSVISLRDRLRARTSAE